MSSNNNNNNNNNNNEKTLIRGTPDVYFGLDNPSAEEWQEWYRVMIDERSSVLAKAKVDANPAMYRDASTNWSDTAFRQLFLFMYDVTFFDRDKRVYRTRELIDQWTNMFGRVDSVLLWHAYPRLGFDSRSQFDFYRDMPGGLEQLRAQVSDVLHANGIRVFVDYNPWDVGTYDELGEIVNALDADGVMLDTMTDAPDVLENAVRAKQARGVERARGERRGVVFAPELRLSDTDLARHRQSWAQWIDMGTTGSGEPSILRARWLLPRHRQLLIRRWDHSRSQDIVYSFWSGSGLILWDNIFGSWNPYSQEDRRLLAETAAIFDRYQDVFVHGKWEPLIPTGVSGLDANRWTHDTPSVEKGEKRSRITILTLRNRTTSTLSYRVPFDVPDGQVCIAFWSDHDRVSSLHRGDSVTIKPLGIQALVVDDATSAQSACAHFHALSKRADVPLPAYETRSPSPIPTGVKRNAYARSSKRIPPEMIALPGTRAHSFEMNVQHERRECGCYPFGASNETLWGWFYKDVVTHTLHVSLTPYAIRKTAVTNAELLAFVHETKYEPRDPSRFLKHIAREPDGSLPKAVSAVQAELPVTFISLEDAWAYAEHKGERLPTEAEWQWAAEGAGLGNKYPWGSEPRTFESRLRPALDHATRTPQGVMGLSGNAWELTESEHTDGHTRFVMLRGGIFLPQGESEWLVARGARPNDFHAKYILLSDGLDRSESISFRTVIDLE